MTNILDISRRASTASKIGLRESGLVYRSCGTKHLDLSEPLSTDTGYWLNPSAVSSKPPRWILHLKAMEAGPLVQFAADTQGRLLPAATVPGYVNNGQGRCAVAAFRLLLAVQVDDQFDFPNGWEWLVQFVFPAALPVGTSGDALSDFSPETRTITYKGRASVRKQYAIAHILIHPSMPTEDQVGHDSAISYERATSMLQQFFAPHGEGASVIDLLEDGGVANTAELIRACLAGSVTHSSATSVDDSVYTGLLARLSSGERGFLTQIAPGLYRVAPPSSGRGSESSNSIEPGEGIE